MADSDTSEFHEYVLEVEKDPDTAPGVFSILAGLTSRSINRQHNMSTTEVPDADDESLPSGVKRGVRSSEVTMSAAGVMARQSHTFLLKWWKDGVTKNARLRDPNATAGNLEYEEGPLYITNVGNSVEKGNGAVGVELSFEFNGVPNQTLKPVV